MIHDAAYSHAAMPECQQPDNRSPSPHRAIAGKSPRHCRPCANPDTAAAIGHDKERGAVRAAAISAADGTSVSVNGAPY
ncbi:hypothetical protein HMPREF1604_03081 [Escherichia coli 908519]|nr:hypothetical protein HMPREF1604_03081 [Escherichia coli 908519]